MIGQKMLMIGAIPADCGIIGSKLDEYEWYPNDKILYVNVVHITGTIYAMVHGYDRGASSGMKISTINIGTDGNIAGSLIAQTTVSSARFNSYSSTIKVSQTGHASGDCVLAIFNKRYHIDEGGTNDCIVRTWRISQAGAINGQIDSLEIGSGGVSSTYSPNCLVRKTSTSNVFASVAFTGNYVPYIFTFDISNAGAIGSVLDSTVIDSDFNVSSYTQIIKVGSHFIASYRKGGAYSINKFKGYTISDVGIIANVSSKDMEFVSGDPVVMLDMTHMGFDGFACSYRTNVATRSKVVSYQVNPSSGAFTGPVDSIFVDDGSYGNHVHINSLSGNGILASWQGSLNAGNLSTITMDASGSFTGVIDTIVMGRYLRYWDYPFPIVGSSNPIIYGISFGGTDEDGYLQTYDVTSICT